MNILFKIAGHDWDQTQEYRILTGIPEPDVV